MKEKKKKKKKKKKQKKKKNYSTRLNNIFRNVMSINTTYLVILSNARFTIYFIIELFHDRV